MTLNSAKPLSPRVTIIAYDRLIMVSRDDNDDMSFSSITARINKVAQMAKSEKRPLLVIVDYLQLLVEDKSNSNAEVSQITSTLKKLALASGAAIILNSQLNRSGRGYGASLMDAPRFGCD